MATISKLFVVAAGLALLQATHGFTTLVLPAPTSSFGAAAKLCGVIPAKSSAHAHHHIAPRRPPGRRTSSLFMAEEEETEEVSEAERRRKQQLGAAALFLFGALYDFFVTHGGVGPWDPNYVL